MNSKAIEYEKKMRRLYEIIWSRQFLEILLTRQILENCWEKDYAAPNH